MTRKTVAFVVLVALQAFAANAAPEPLVFGVFPRWNAQITVRDFVPLASLLERELGRAVRVETDKDFDSFMRRVYAREFHLVHLNQLQYLRARRTAGYRVIAKICDNPSCTIRAVIVTRRDAGFAKPADLRGSTIAFGDPSAMVSHVLARSLLREHGVEPTQYQTLLARNPPNALLAVYNGEAHAAGVGTLVLQAPEIRQRVDVGELRVLAESRPIPHLPIAVRGDLDAKLVQRLQRTLTGMARDPQGREALHRIGIERIDAADDSQYAIVGELAEDDAHGD
jgi:phosphonate transport system substrate-binding protein